MLSKKAKYGLQALIALAKGSRDNPILIQELARQEQMPRKFLEAILLDLKRHGILESKKGRGGGYKLAKPAHEIKLGQVVRILSGPLAPISCVSQTAYRKCHDCPNERNCGVRMVMKEVRDSIARVLDQRSIGDVLGGLEILDQDKLASMVYQI